MSDLIRNVSMKRKIKKPNLGQVLTMILTRTIIGIREHSIYISLLINEEFKFVCFIIREIVLYMMITHREIEYSKNI